MLFGELSYFSTTTPLLNSSDFIHCDLDTFPHPPHLLRCPAGGREEGELPCLCCSLMEHSFWFSDSLRPSPARQPSTFLGRSLIPRSPSAAITYTWTLNTEQELPFLILLLAFGRRKKNWLTHLQTVLPTDTLWCCFDSLPTTVVDTFPFLPTFFYYTACISYVPFYRKEEEQQTLLIHGC